MSGNPYDAFPADPDPKPKRDSLAPAPPPSSPPVVENPYDEFPLIDPKDTLSAAMDVGLRQNPDLFANSVKLSRSLAIPREVAEREPDMSAAAQIRRSLDPEALLFRSPVTASFLSNPQNAAVAHDDIDNLEGLEALFGGWTKPLFGKDPTPGAPNKWVPGLIQRGLIAGSRQRDLAELQLAASKLKIDPEDMPGYAEAEAKAKGPDLTGRNILTRVIASPAEILPGMVVGSVRGAAYAAAAEGATIAAGSLGGPVGTAVGGAGGVPLATGAFLFGVGADTYDQERGGAYAETVRRMKDEVARGVPGARVDYEAAARRAKAAGLMNAALEVGGTGLLFGIFPVLSKVGAKVLGKEAARMAAEEALAPKAGMVKTALKALLGVAASTTEEATTEALQRAETIAMVEGGVEESGGSPNRGRILPESWAEFKGAAESMVLLGGFGAAGTFVDDVASARDARAARDRLLKLGEVVQQSRLQKRLPEKTAELAGDLVKAGVAPESLFVPVAEFQQFWQEQGQDPAEVARTLGVETNYRDALVARSDVAIPFETYVSRIADKTFHSAFSEIVKFDPEDMTFKAAEEFKANAPARIDEVAAQMGEEVKQVEADRVPSEKLQEKIAKQLVERGGQTLAQAEASASLPASLFRTLEARIGVEPGTLSKGYELEVVNPLVAPRDALLQGNEPNASATLFQRDITQADASLNFKPEETADGKLKGVPESVNAPTTVAGRRKAWRKIEDRFRSLAKIGEGARHWYRDSARAVLDLVGGDIEEAERFIQLLAIYSPQRPVFTNANMAVKAYTHWKLGGPRETLKVNTGVQDKKAAAVLYDDTSMGGGRKIGSFYPNLMHEIWVQASPSERAKLKVSPDVMEAIQSPVTIDVWMLRAAGFDVESATDDKGAGKYSTTENLVLKIAAELNQDLEPGQEPWTGYQVQAAIWTAIKAEHEGLPIGQAAGINFATSLASVSNTITTEAIPTTAINSPINSAPAGYREAFTKEILDQLNTPEGLAELSRIAGVSLASVTLSSGGYAGGINPGLVFTFTPVKTAGDRVSKVAADMLARAIQYAFKQDAVPYFRAEYAATRKKAAERDVRSLQRKESRGEELTPEERLTLDTAGFNAGFKFTFAQALTPEAERAFFDELISATTGDMGYTLLDGRRSVSIINYGAMDGAAFAAAIGQLGEAHEHELESYGRFDAEGAYGPVHDWAADPEGESILGSTPAAQRPALQSWARRWRLTHAAILEKHEGRLLNAAEPGPERFVYDPSKQAPVHVSEAKVAKSDLPGPSARELERDLPVSGVTGALDRPRGLLGRTAASEFKARGYVDLNGRRVRGAADLAYLARVYRDPRIETLRLFYIKDGKIIAQEARTSFRPDTVNFAFNKMTSEDTIADIRDRLERTGADGFWLLHNHPSGKATPSDPDINMTHALSNLFKGQLLGHVVIDHGEFGHIDTQDKEAARVAAEGYLNDLMREGKRMDAMAWIPVRRVLAWAGLKTPGGLTKDNAAGRRKFTAAFVKWALTGEVAIPEMKDTFENMRYVEGRVEKMGRVAPGVDPFRRLVAAAKGVFSQDLLGQGLSLSSPERTRSLARQVASAAGRAENSALVFYVDTQHQIRGIEEIATTSLARGDVKALIKGRLNTHAARWAIPYLDAKSGPANNQALASLGELINDDLVLDVIHDTGGLRGGMFEPQRGMSFGLSEQEHARRSRRLFQTGEDKQGYIKFTRGEKSFEIGLLEKANLSTFLHETGHFFLEVLGDVAESDKATPEIKADYEAALKWLGVSSRDQIETVHHEKWARAFETYLMEGKAPSASMAAAFARFRSWLVALYRKFSPGLRPTEEVRAVMDRLLATDDEIVAAERTTAAAPMFETMDDGAMTLAQWERYRETANQATEEARSELQDRLLSEVRREREAWWREETEKVREEVAAQVDSKPAHQANAFLRRGIMLSGEEAPPDIAGKKLSLPDVVALFGDGPEGKRIQRSLTGAMVAEGGLHPDAFAPFFNFKSGSEMIQAMLAAGSRQRAIATRTKAVMLERHGDLLSDGSIADAAQDAMHTSSARLRQYEMEYNALTRKAGARGKLTPAAVMKQEAERQISRVQIRNLRPDEYARAEGKANRAARGFERRGEFEQARTEVQRATFTHYLYRAATEAREESEKQRKFLQKSDNDATRARLGKAGDNYRDQQDKLLEAYEFRRSLSVKASDKRQALREWIAEQEALGQHPEIPAWLVEESKTTSWKNLTVEELAGLHDSVVNIQALAGLKSTYLTKNKRVAEAAVRKELLDAADANMAINKRALPDDRNYPSSFDQVASEIAGLDANLLRIETLINFLDGNQVDGPWHRYILDLIQDAKIAELDRAGEVGKAFDDLTLAIPAEIRARGKETVALEGIGDRSRTWLICMALNTGNDGNYQRLMDGFKWAPGTIEKALSRLTSEELDFVQGVWDLNETLKPDAAALYKRRTGLPFPEVKARSFDVILEDGSKKAMRGGYYTIKYESERSVQGEAQIAETVAQFFESDYTHASTSRGYSKERLTDFSRRLDLRLSVIPNHYAQIIHDIAFGEAVESIGKLLLHPEIRESMQRHLGEERAQAFLPWLKATANYQSYAMSDALTKFDKWVERGRSTLTASTLALKATIFTGNLANIVTALRFVGPVHMSKAIAMQLRHPIRSWREAQKESGEVRHRMELFDRDIRENVGKLQGKHTVGANAMRFGYAFTASTDLVTTIPIFHAAKFQALKEGKDYETAVRYAGSIIRQVVGSGHPVDLPAVMRSRGMIRLVTMYYGYSNAQYQSMRLSLNDIQKARLDRAVGSRLPYILAKATALVIGNALAGELLASRGPDDDDDGEGLLQKYGSWALRKALLWPASTVPFARDLARAVDAAFEGGQGEYSFTPLAKLGDKAAAVLKDVLYDIPFGEEEPLDSAKDFIDAGAIVMPGGQQLDLTGTYIFDLLYRNTDYEDFPTFMHDLAYRRPKERR